MAIDEEHVAPSVEEESPEVRARRAAVMGGVGLVWAAFMAAIGLLLPAVLVITAAAGGVGWILGLRLPRPDLRRLGTGTRASATTIARHMRRASRRSVRLARSTGVAGKRAAAAFSSRLVSIPAPAARVGARVSATTSSVLEAVRGRGARIAQSRRSRSSDPRVEEALVSNSHGIALAKAGKHAEAIDAFDTALALLADTGDRHHEGQVLANLGTVHRRIGGAEAARFCWTRALERLEPGTRESQRTAELLGVR